MAGLRLSFIVIILAAAISVAVIFDFYPIVFVNLRPIIYSEFKDNIRASKQFYESQGLSHPELQIDFSSPSGQEKLKEIKRGVLESMIEDRLLRSRLSQIPDVNLKRIEQRMQEKIEAAIGGRPGEAVEKGVWLLYGWDLETFKERILVPQALREVVEEELKIREKNFDNWLLEQKQKSSIFILLPGFRWDKEKGEVVLTK